MYFLLLKINELFLQMIPCPSDKIKMKLYDYQTRM